MTRPFNMNNLKLTLSLLLPPKIRNCPSIVLGILAYSVEITHLTFDDDIYNMLNDDEKNIIKILFYIFGHNSYKICEFMNYPMDGLGPEKRVCGLSIYYPPIKKQTKLKQHPERTEKKENRRQKRRYSHEQYLIDYVNVYMKDGIYRKPRQPNDEKKIEKIILRTKFRKYFDDIVEDETKGLEYFYKKINDNEITNIKYEVNDFQLERLFQIVWGVFLNFHTCDNEYMYNKCRLGMIYKNDVWVREYMYNKWSLGGIYKNYVWVSELFLTGQNALYVLNNNSEFYKNYYFLPESKLYTERYFDFFENYMKNYPEKTIDKDIKKTFNIYLNNYWYLKSLKLYSHLTFESFIEEEMM